jgi:hypothetical protein
VEDSDKGGLFVCWRYGFSGRSRAISQSGWMSPQFPSSSSGTTAQLLLLTRRPALGSRKQEDNQSNSVSGKERSRGKQL